MKIVRLVIQNFRGIKEATIHFDSHTLLVGSNNAGKSTICEALDLALGPERLNKYPPIEEFDFYNSGYLEEDGLTPRPFRIEVLLTDLTSEAISRCGGHLEFWNSNLKTLLSTGDIGETSKEEVKECIRLEIIGKYSHEEDEFEAQTFFSFSPSELDGNLKVVSRSIKRLFGFLYLRTLRTGSRALSLERGSLLDVILRINETRSGLWEETIKRLRELNPPIDQNASGLREILDSIESRISEYIPIDTSKKATSLFVSNLTREHLRKTISFFLSMTPDQHPVPFQEVGTGTLNTLVLALLSFIAESKKENVIFAMEEPEIALPPHTQRRIANYLLTKTTQCFVTSHSPYIIEVFEPNQILILRRDASGIFSSKPIVLEGSIKPKNYKSYSRRGISEAMLGRGVILVEGFTEQVVFWAVANKMQQNKESYYPIDLSGVTIFSTDGDGLMPDFGSFFNKLDLTTFAFYDKKERRTEIETRFTSSFFYSVESPFKGIEKLLAEEIPVDVQWQFWQVHKSEVAVVDIAGERPSDSEIKLLSIRLLKGYKGEGTAGRLIDHCTVDQLPKSLTDFFKTVYREFPMPISKKT
jgi:putative ATP-dependent endonuclease of OLD family